MRSSNQQHFAQIPDVKLPRSVFNRSHTLKTTFNAGLLIPVFCDIAYPGDTFNVRMTSFCRLATPLKPIMDNMYLNTYFFSVPIRLIWSNFQKFMGERVNPDDSVDYVVPTMTAPATTGHIVGSLSDYFGIPTGVPGLVHSSLWHRAYAAIYRDWFRDENLIDSPVVDTDDGPDNPSDYPVQRKAKIHDYFTSCLPWPQKGDAVMTPLGTTAPVISTGNPFYVNDNMSNDKMLVSSNGSQLVQANTAWSNPANNLRFGKIADRTATGLIVDLSDATAATINELRQAFQVQRLLERDARGGSRYIEIVRSHFSVTSPDLRAIRPVYLGGGVTPINIHSVPQTTPTPASGSVTTPQGNLAAFGTVSGQSGFVQSFTEHCLLIGLACVTTVPTYQQGLPRMFSYSTKYDFYWPSLAFLGEQAVLNKEIYAKNDANDDAVFGYQERWSEMRFKFSQVTGSFRSTHSTPLDQWHLAQEFETLPTLSQTFIEENAPMARVIAVPSETHFLFDSYFDMKCVRPMPVYGVPGMIDHF